MNQIELRHLRYFLAVAETENFTRAAERLNVSQPSISQQIKDLETALKTPLFDRLGKRVRLTQAGLAFRERAVIVLRKLDEALDAVEHVEELLAGHVDVGVVPALNVPWVPPVLERFSAEYPGVTIAVHERSSSEVETEVEAGRYDLGLGLLSYSSPNIRYERVASEELMLLVPEKHPLASKTSVAVRELEDVRLVCLPEAFVLRQMVDELFRRAKSRPKVIFQIDAIDATLATVVRTGTATLLPAVVLEGRKSLGLRAIRLVGKNQRIDFGLMWPMKSDPSPAARLFASFVLEASHRSEHRRTLK
ncbi:LysR substrate-binding domain-containing protein [Myxococcota bacterium]|nr:LysR substrate-binding domain-containing protein [Myxococcota bacterium]